MIKRNYNWCLLAVIVALAAQDMNIAFAMMILLYKKRQKEPIFLLINSAVVVPAAGRSRDDLL